VNTLRVQPDHYPLHEGYPDSRCASICCGIGEELGLRLDDLPALRLPRSARPGPERYATLQPKAGWSAYKNWPVERWAEVLEVAGDSVFQLGRADETPVPGAAPSWAHRSRLPYSLLPTRTCTLASIPLQTI
jgi:hypothetical protein